jgi:hypothetical protein
MLLAQNDATGAEGAGDATEGGEAGAGGEGVPQTDVRRSNRMEFDPRLIKGQSAGSGAVFLYQRTPRPLPSMVERRSTFLRATVQSELGEEGASQFDDARRETLEREAREANRDEK